MTRRPAAMVCAALAVAAHAMPAAAADLSEVTVGVSQVLAWIATAATAVLAWWANRLSGDIRDAEARQTRRLAEERDYWSKVEQRLLTEISNAHAKAAEAYSAAADVNLHTAKLRNEITAVELKLVERLAGLQPREDARQAVGRLEAKLDALAERLDRH